ncbi:MAG: hypothetical protein MHPSP_002736, partial [Paramarteilia canceri]
MNDDFDSEGTSDCCQVTLFNNFFGSYTLYAQTKRLNKKLKKQRKELKNDIKRTKYIDTKEIDENMKLSLYLMKLSSQQSINNWE